MKWMLVVVVFGTAPVKTGLLYNDLDTCWAAREPIAQEIADVVNNRLRWAADNLTGETSKESMELVLSALTENRITCIPHADEP